MLAEAMQLIEEVLSCAPVAVRLTWDAMHRGLDLSLDASAALGADAFALAAATDDFRIGTKAFLDKTPDRTFHGR